MEGTGLIVGDVLHVSAPFVRALLSECQARGVSQSELLDGKITAETLADFGLQFLSKTVMRSLAEP